MTVETTGTVTMQGAKTVDIPPSQISPDGTYATRRTVTAVAQGDFGVIVTVKVDKEN
ncbi:MAG TPA: hypothetical protein VE961_25330 [Pyrinomonadaceae bacterium]|nr:hypothetical protein [Pyrinomonadaceae bacterium]